MSRGSSNEELRHGVTSMPPWEEGHVDTTQARRDSPLSSSPKVSPFSKEIATSNTTGENNDLKVQYAERCARFFATPEDNVTPIQVDTPLTAPPLGALPQRSPEIPQGPRSTPYPPKFVKPPTPILETPSIPSTSDTSSTVSPQTPHPVVALPGTMSSRRERSRSRARALPKTRNVQKKQPLVSRWKSKVKDMFNHVPPDETQLVRIQDRHWADEDF